MSQSMSNLLAEVARIHFGDVESRVVSALVAYGRLSARELGSRAKASPKLVKRSLVSLIQFNCIRYWTDKEPLYSINETGLIVILRSGAIVSHIREHYGEEEAAMIYEVLQHGNVKVSQVSRENQEVLARLYKEGWLKAIGKRSFEPLEDVWHTIFLDSLKNTVRTATTSEVKRVAEAKERAKILLDEHLSHHNDIFIMENGYQRLRGELVVTFDLARFEKHLRTLELTSLARSRVGPLSAAVYESALQLIEKSSPDFRHPYLGIDGLINDPEHERVFVNSIENQLVDDGKTTFSARQVASVLPKGLDLTNSILTHNFLKPKKRSADDEGSKRVKLENGHVEKKVDHSKEDSIEDSSSSFLVDQHLKLLTSSTQVQFLIMVAPGTYTVPFKVLNDQIKRFNYEALIKKTLGSDAFRVLRALKSLKLADERALATVTLLKEKTVRSELYRLMQHNVIEIQEVPRSADRAASKAFFLYRHKEFPSYKSICEAMIFSMGDELATIQSMKEDHRILLLKSEREDVRGHEEELLLQSELKTLRQLHEREVYKIARLNRIYSLYTVFNLP